MDWIEKKWRDHCDATGICELNRDIGWVMLSNLYAGRPYHNIQHAGDMIAYLHDRNVIPEVKLSLQDRSIVETAIWFHDAIYSATAPKGKNEEHSAGLALMFLMGNDDRNTRRYLLVHRCIIATRHDVTPIEDIERVICDLDLMGLASEQKVYIGNSRRIRQEFAHLDDAAWLNGRAAFLRGMLSRAHVFHTDGFRTMMERSARENMQAELDYVTAKMTG